MILKGKRQCGISFSDMTQVIGVHDAGNREEEREPIRGFLF